ncbi:MAG: hypothetical protein GY716_25820 [bacterium]|nr:hypothetical protein [bacterium]
MEQPGKKLESWKEIAAFFNVTVRTVQYWEKERRLPVHRLEGFAKPRVFAYDDELRRWQSPDGTSPPPAGRPRLRIVVAAAVTLLLTSAILVSSRLPTPRPMRAEVEGTILQVYGHGDRLLWQRDFPDLGDHDPGATWLARIVDLDGDGVEEVLFNHTRDEARGQSGSLECFRADGASCGRSVPFGRRLERTEPRGVFEIFAAREIELVEIDGMTLVVSVATHQPRYACEVALIDPLAGRKIDTYYHPGSLLEILVQDLDGDSRPELLLGGVRNPEQPAGLSVLSILKLPFSAGGSRTDFFGNDGPQELAYLVFPPSRVLRSKMIEPSVNDAWLDPQGLLSVEIGAGPSVHYEFDVSDLSDIRVANLRPADAFFHQQRLLDGESETDSVLSPADDAALRNVLVFDGCPPDSTPQLMARFD